LHVQDNDECKTDQLENLSNALRQAEEEKDEQKALVEKLTKMNDQYISQVEMHQKNVQIITVHGNLT